MKTACFDFDLPESAIALRPARPRDSARLLQVMPDGSLSDHIVSDLPGLLRAGDVLVLNETRVIRAALRAMRPARDHGGGGEVSVDLNLHAQTSEDTWRAFARPAKRLRIGDTLYFSGGLEADVLDKQSGGEVVLKFNHAGDDLSTAIEAAGHPPLPPYIARKRESDSQDVSDYQTIFAKESGSVAAPTSGLHFTPGLFDQLEAAGIQIERLVLHVGAGTFLPVKSDDTGDHKMHSEWYDIDAATAERINLAKTEGRRIVAVGTTALRALESAAQGGRLQAKSDDTDIFITPGYDFNLVDGLMTNFHLPRSTLFMLVSALAGLDTMQSAYRHAIETGYRFYSYGDASLLWKAA